MNNEEALYDGFSSPYRAYFAKTHKFDQQIRKIKMAVKQTVERTVLGAFAPKFAELNDDVLFGQVWTRG